jgi:site-specific recombinase XerD
MDVQKAMDDFLFYLEVEKNYSPNTLRSYAFDLHCFSSFLHKQQRSTDLQSLDITTARRFIQDQVLSYGVKPRTLQRRISSFSHYCVREKWIMVDFMGGIDAPKTDKRLPVYMKLEELRMLFRKLECEEHEFAIRNELIFKFLATTGMRRQELVDLNWEHIDFGTNTVRVMGKRNKERLLPLHSSVIPLFISYRKSLRPDQLYPNEPVFLNRFGQRIDPRGFLHNIRIYLSAFVNHRTFLLF